MSRSRRATLVLVVLGTLSAAPRRGSEALRAWLKTLDTKAVFVAGRYFIRVGSRAGADRSSSGVTS